MSNYESNDDVQPARVVTYRHLVRARRRGWAVPSEPEPSLADLVSDRGTGVRRGARSTGAGHRS